MTKTTFREAIWKYRWQNATIDKGGFRKPLSTRAMADTMAEAGLRVNYQTIQRLSTDGVFHPTFINIQKLSQFLGIELSEAAEAFDFGEEVVALVEWTSAKQSKGDKK